MNLQTELENNKLKHGLYVVSTPIGNLEDISLRALDVLRNSDFILCEDTRVSKKLLSRYKINKKLISNHKFNEKKNLQKVIDILRSKKIVSLISDAGTPTISDGISMGTEGMRYSLPTRELITDSIESIPSRPLIASSSGVVTSRSTSSAEAPV